MFERVRIKYKSKKDNDPPTEPLKPIKPLPIVYDGDGNPIISRKDAEGTRIMTRLEHQTVEAAYEENKMDFRSEKYLRKETRKALRNKIVYMAYPLFEVGVVAGIVLGTDYDKAARPIGPIAPKHSIDISTPDRLQVDVFIGKELKEVREHQIQGLMDTIAAPSLIDPANLHSPMTLAEMIGKNMAGSNKDIIDGKRNTIRLRRVVLGKHTYHFNTKTDSAGITKLAYLDDVFLDNGSTFVKSLEFKRDALGGYTVQGFPQNSLGMTVDQVPFFAIDTRWTDTFPTVEQMDIFTKFVNDTLLDASFPQPVIKAEKKHK